MKKSILITVLLLLISVISFSQTLTNGEESDLSTSLSKAIEAGQKNSKPIYITEIDSVIYELAIESLEKIDPNWLKSVSIYNPKSHSGEPPARYQKYHDNYFIVLLPRKLNEESYRMLVKKD